MDEDDLWMSEDEEQEDTERDYSRDPTFFKLELTYQGELGGFHTRNEPGKKQRKVVTSRGGKKRSRFSINSTAKAIIHGTMDEVSCAPATLLVYDFEFSCHKSSARIKEAEIAFDFQPKDGSASSGPSVTAIKPKGTHAMIETSEKKTNKLDVEGNLGVNFAGLGLGGKVAPGKSVEKTTTHATVITGVTPADDWGNQYTAHWSLIENTSQESGVPSFLRAVILLRRETNDEFICVPFIEAKFDLKSQLYTLLSTETPDDPILFDPEYEPFNDLEDVNFRIDSKNLAAVDLDELWDCTFYNKFGQPIKASKAAAAVVVEMGAPEVGTGEIK